MDETTSFANDLEFDENYRDPDPIRTERLVNEEDEFHFTTPDEPDYDQQILEHILRESLLPENINPMDTREKENRSEMCKELLQTLKRTKRYIPEDDLMYKIIIDFCDESGSLALENEIFEKFHQTLMLLVENKKVSQETANYIVMNTDVQLH